MEGQGENAEPVLPDRLVVDLHVIVKGFFVT